MWRIVIYDKTQADEPAIAICELRFRGEYAVVDHTFDDSRFRYKTITDAEQETMEAFGIDLPVRNINDFCLRPRHGGLMKY